jgi:uncharacterized membrane protein YjgN (DUF898 family)
MTAIDATAGVPSSVPAAPAMPAAAGSVRFLGKDAVYWRLLIRGAVLLMVTLGIYRFWLVTDMRRFLWASTEIADDTLEYAGTAREILIGFLIAITLLVPINVAFFIGGLSILGQWSAVIAFIVLAWFGQFAVYRARRYRLTRTVFRGIRFHQEGAAWRYAFCALTWWTLSALTLGLAYPWAQASLERYKMRNTYYGNLGARFVGSGTGLFFRGALLWLIVIGPFLAALIVATRSVDWLAVGAALARGGSNPLGRIESISPNFGSVLAAVMIAGIWSVVLAALLYPAFQALLLRWWTSGIRFGEMTAKSRLRTGQMYGVYLRFVGYALLFVFVAAIVGGAVFLLFTASLLSFATSELSEIVGTAIAIVGYVIVMLGYSTIYQATVKLRSWRVAFESLELSGLQVLDNVEARGVPSSAFGEGLADALNVGGM